MKKIRENDDKPRWAGDVEEVSLECPEPRAYAVAQRVVEFLFPIELTLRRFEVFLCGAAEGLRHVDAPSRVGPQIPLGAAVKRFLVVMSSALSYTRWTAYALSVSVSA